MREYHNLKEKYKEDYHLLKKKYNYLSATRLFAIILLIFSVYNYFSTANNIYLFLSIIFFISFLLILVIHDKISWSKKVIKEIISINNDEINYLNGKENPFVEGSEYIDYDHLYSFDLDFFGKNSLYQNLNRTATYIGGEKLSELLLSLLSQDEIKSNQKAIQELSKKIIWRQNLFSISRLTKDNKEKYEKLIKWSDLKHTKTSEILNFIFYLIPFGFIFLTTVFALTKNLNYFYASITAFLLNSILILTQLKKIKKEVINSEKIHVTIKKYGLIIKHIEDEKFESKKLNSIKEKLISQSSLASKQINKLSSLFSNLDSIHNGFAAIILNGSFLYHLFIFNKLLKWKAKNSKEIKIWLEVIGEFETLCSLANFSYNNPKFCFPEINNNHKINFKELGHPLINNKKRICNDIEFVNEKFIILTGSNMSGKSTFLRTLGVNMVLAGIGAPICSNKANIHPLKVIVSMRQSDSLNEGESYFYAEVKRLKKIMDSLSSETCFVLLDEILKGTNSEDKKIGTVEVIKQMISKNAIGAIATHDLDVCKITQNHPNILTNICFEAEIINDNLSFDYKLKSGICKNKSATFLIKKMGVI